MADTKRLVAQATNRSFQHLDRLFRFELDLGRVPRFARIRPEQVGDESEDGESHTAAEDTAPVGAGLPARRQADSGSAQG